MKLILFLLLCFQYSSGEIINQNNNKKLEGQILKFDIKLYENMQLCNQNENNSAHFELLTNCQCYRDENDCITEVIHRPEFLNYNWSTILNDYNMSYVNISDCIINNPENNCFSCDNITLNFYTENNNNICYSIYFLFIIVILIILGICILGIYFIIKNNRRNDYQNIDGRRRYRFFNRK